MKKMATVMAGAALMLGLSSMAHAIPTLYLQNGASNLTVEDNSALDINSAAGIITFNGAFGAFNILNVSTGVSLQGQNFPYIDLNSIDGSTTATSSTLLLKFGDTNFNGNASPSLGFNIGGTAGSSISYAAYYDTSNTLFGTGTLIGSGTSGAGAFSYTSPTVAMPTSTFSLTEILSITHPGSSVIPIITSFDAEIAPVPEPGTMLLLGAGFLGLAIYGKRRKNA